MIHDGGQRAETCRKQPDSAQCAANSNRQAEHSEWEKLQTDSRAQYADIFLSQRNLYADNYEGDTAYLNDQTTNRRGSTNCTVLTDSLPTNYSHSTVDGALREP